MLMAVLLTTLIIASLRLGYVIAVALDKADRRDNDPRR